MIITKPLEIKVALLGYVSVGKSTILNALFQDKYAGASMESSVATRETTNVSKRLILVSAHIAEVSMRRTTAGINFFRIVHI